MLESKRYEGIFFIFLFSTMLICICSGRWLVNGEISIIQALASFHAMSFGASGGMSIPTGITAWWDALVTAFAWDYPFLESTWLIWIKFILWIFSFGAIIGLIQLGFQFATTVAQWARGLL
jgi:hypothetical protein